MSILLSMRRYLPSAKSSDRPRQMNTLRLFGRVIYGKATVSDVEALAERKRFGDLLDSLGIPDVKGGHFQAPKWSEGASFNRKTFDSKAYHRAYMRDIRRSE